MRRACAAEADWTVCSPLQDYCDDPLNDLGMLRLCWVKGVLKWMADAFVQGHMITLPLFVTMGDQPVVF